MCGTDVVPYSDLVSTNAMTVIRVIINKSTVTPVNLWPCRQVDIGSSFLEILVTWQIEDPEEESEQTFIWSGFA